MDKNDKLWNYFHFLLQCYRENRHIIERYLSHLTVAVEYLDQQNVDLARESEVLQDKQQVRNLVVH